MSRSPNWPTCRPASPAGRLNPLVTCLYEKYDAPMQDAEDAASSMRRGHRLTSPIAKRQTSHVRREWRGWRTICEGCACWRRAGILTNVGGWSGAR